MFCRRMWDRCGTAGTVEPGNTNLGMITTDKCMMARNVKVDTSFAMPGHASSVYIIVSIFIYEIGS